YLFAFQIYCDFSGYSDIAIGISKVMGYDLKENFKLPYFSKSITEFWRRWHISLSSWLRDYLYISLGGSKKGSYRTYSNLLIIMMLLLLCNDAVWHYRYCGEIIVIVLVLKKIFMPNQIKAVLILNILSNIISLCIVFSVNCFSWLFCR